ncbi:MAG TPA: hypothetical protein PLN52_15085 [Opitutaceae bacterium]|nr:hypothetical protein [Opitutaceae bacterium]
MMTPSRSRPSLLRLEVLETRQLLATIVAGSGVEVASNIVHANGNTYDQILLTGPTITVTADPGEVVRISFLDQGGDIVQTEFSGKGTLTLSLEDLKRSGDAGYTNPNPPQTLPAGGYVQGLASITLEKPELSTNLGIYAAGKVQNPGFFNDPTRNGHNGLAEIARVVLTSDSSNAAGYSNMGGLYMGGVVFTANEGVAGIRAPLVALQNIVSIGDIDSKGTAKPYLLFNTNSQFQNVFIRGGDLKQTNDAPFEPDTIGGFYFFNRTDGTRSDGTPLPRVPIDERVFRLVTGYQSYTAPDPVIASIGEPATSLLPVTPPTGIAPTPSFSLPHFSVVGSSDAAWSAQSINPDDSTLDLWVV